MAEKGGKGENRNMASEAMKSQGLGRRGSDLETPFETTPVETHLPGKFLAEKGLRPAGAAGGAAVGGPGVGLEAFFTEMQKAAMEHIKEYKEAGTEEEQRKLWRTWLLRARHEAALGRPGEWLETTKQLGTLPESLVYKGEIKSPDLWVEQQIVWKTFEARRAISACSGPVGENGASNITADIDGAVLKYLFGNESLTLAGEPVLAVKKGDANLGNISAAEAITFLDSSVEVDNRPYVSKDGKTIPNEKYGLTKKTWAKTVADGLAKFKINYGNTVDAEYVYQAGVDIYMLANEQAKYGFKDYPSWSWMAKTNTTIDMLGCPGGSPYIKEQIIRGRVMLLLNGFLSESTGRSPRTNRASAGNVATDPAFRLRTPDLKKKDFEDYEEYDPGAGGFEENPDRASLLSVYYARNVNNVMGLVEKIKGEELVEIFTKDPGAAFKIIVSAGASFLPKSSMADKSAFLNELMSLWIEFDRRPKQEKSNLDYKDWSKTVGANDAARGIPGQKPIDVYPPLNDEYAFSRIRGHGSFFKQEDYLSLVKQYAPNILRSKGERFVRVAFETTGHTILGGVMGAIGLKGK